MNRSQHFKEKRRTTRFKKMTILLMFLMACSIVGGIWRIIGETGAQGNQTTQKTGTATKPQNRPTLAKTAPSKKTNAAKAVITASGDMLYHDILYRSAYDGTRYDLDNDYAQIMPIMEKADLSLGDFEGTINPDRELTGYPLFNAPKEVAENIKAAGFDVVDLAHNHILDTGLDGVRSTVSTFKSIGVDTIGVKTEETADILIKKVNGIKIALLAYSYGFNGIEASLTQEEYDQYLKDLNMEKVAADLKKAEELADITIVMPQAGVEYALEPSQEQQDKYRQMVDLGADIIFGGHPHVAEPTETIEKDGEKKFIIYSMGNLISDQRFESVDNYWTERGVVMEVEITKDSQGTRLTNVKANPTWVDKEPIAGRTYQHPEYGTVQSQDYQVFLAENYLPGGKFANDVSEEKRQRIETAYHEMLELLNIQW